MSAAVPPGNVVASSNIFDGVSTVASVEGASRGTHVGTITSPASRATATSVGHRREGASEWQAPSLSAHGLLGAVRSRINDEAGRRPLVAIRYAPRFKRYLVLLILASAAWIAHYFMVVLPTMEVHVELREAEPSCGDQNQLLSHDVRMLFVYFVWFALTRLSLLVPCIALRVAPVQTRTPFGGPVNCVHLPIQDGPLYLFVLGFVLFWLKFLQNSACESSPELDHCLVFFAVHSCLLGVLCMVFTYWHNKLLFDAVRRWHEPDNRSAPPDTISKLQTVRYDKAVFGDEEGKLYPSECAICLGAWEEDDVIKTTRCQHAFHEDCIGNWLKTARTCALCREDLTKHPSATGAGVQTIGLAQNV